MHGMNSIVPEDGENGERLTERQGMESTEKRGRPVGENPTETERDLHLSRTEMWVRER